MNCSCNNLEAFNTSSMEERSETPVLLIYKVTSTTSTTSHSAQSETTYHVRMSKDVKELSIKRSNTAGKITMSMKKGRNHEVNERKGKLPSSLGPKSSLQQKLETTTGSKRIIPESTSLTTHGAEKSNYDNQAYWTEILQTNGGLDLLAQASQDYSGAVSYPFPQTAQQVVVWIQRRASRRNRRMVPKNECTGSQLQNMGRSVPVHSPNQRRKPREYSTYQNHCTLQLHDRRMLPE